MADGEQSAVISNQWSVVSGGFVRATDSSWAPGSLPPATGCGRGAVGKDAVGRWWRVE
jgi:hypothetical protein